MYKIFITEKCQKRKTNLHSEFKMYRNTLSKITKLSKNKYFRQYYSEYKDDIKMAWKGIKSIIHTKPVKDTLPSFMDIYKNNISDSKAISNAFNDFLSTIAGKTKAKIIKTNKSFSAYLINPNNKSIFMKPTSAEEVKKVILGLSDKNSNGPTFDTNCKPYM